MKRTFRATPSCTKAIRASKSLKKTPVRCESDWKSGFRDWDEDRYFNYLYESYGEDLEGADNEIDAMYGNWALPDCFNDTDYSEIQDMYHDWFYSNHGDEESEW